MRFTNEGFQQTIIAVVAVVMIILCIVVALINGEGCSESGGDATSRSSESSKDGSRDTSEITIP